MKKYKNLYLLSSMLFSIIILFSCCKDTRLQSKYPPITIISFNENRQDYSVEAVSGQVIVIFNKNIPHSQAVKEIYQLNGKIISQIVNARYYLIDTGIGNETYFLSLLNNNPNIKYAYFNAVEYPCKINPQTYVMDNFYISHGDNVKYALKECGLTTKINTYNVGKKGDKEGRMSWGEIDRDLISILSFPTKDTPLIINMSFGPSFINPDIDYWTDKEITDEVKKDYVKQYKESLRHIAGVTSDYKDKDFIIVKAAGNEGLKQLDIEILNDLGRELTNDEIKILNEHFLLVGAVDKRDAKYSNTVTKGTYSFLYTSVDISDLKNNNENLYGTSFAAPRVSCFISKSVNENDIKATETLKVIKDITRKNPETALTQEIINKDVKIIADSKQKTKEPANKPAKVEISNNVKNNAENPANTTNSLKPNNIYGNIIGTKWECNLTDYLPDDMKNYFGSVKEILEFQNDNQVIININYGHGSIENKYICRYYYDEKEKKWIVYLSSDIIDFLFSNEKEDKRPYYFYMEISKNKMILIDPLSGDKDEFIRIN